MRPFSQSSLASAVSLSGGLGFLAHGPNIDKELETSQRLLTSLVVGRGVLPVGIGYQLFQDSLPSALRTIAAHKPAAAWLFAAKNQTELGTWAREITKTTAGATRIWVQVGSVADAEAAIKACGTDIVLVAQGTDAGGHGLARGAGVLSLLPEMKDMLVRRGWAAVPVLGAGGIVEERASAAVMVLGADGIVMGTRFLASQEAGTNEGFRRRLVEAEDGGQVTVRTRLFDDLRGLGDPERGGWTMEYDGRGLINRSVRDGTDGVEIEENIKTFKEALKKPEEGYGEQGRLIAYAGTGVGLIDRVKSASEIVEDVRSRMGKILKGTSSTRLEKL